MTELTPEQRKKLDKLGMKFILKGLWNGAHHAAMAMAATFVLFMFLSLNNAEDSIMMTLGSFIIAFLTMRRMMRIQLEEVKQLKEAAEKIIKN